MSSSETNLETQAVPPPRVKRGHTIPGDEDLTDSSSMTEDSSERAKSKKHRLFSKFSRKSRQTPPPVTQPLLPLKWKNRFLFWIYFEDMDGHLACYLQATWAPISFFLGRAGMFALCCIFYIYFSSTLLIISLIMCFRYCTYFINNFKRHLIPQDWPKLYTDFLRHYNETLACSSTWCKVVLLFVLFNFFFSMPLLKSLWFCKLPSKTK